MKNANLLKNYVTEIGLFKRRLLVISCCLVALSLVLIFRLSYLQILHHETYSTLSEQNHLVLLPTVPRRGLIYDRNGVLLAANKPIFSIDVLPEEIDDLYAELAELKKIIPLSADELNQFDNNWDERQRLQAVPLKLNLTEEEVARFYLNRYRLPGMAIGARLIRYYPLGEDMVSVLGYMSRINKQEKKSIDATNYRATDFIGKIGVEKYYETELHGKVGYQQVEVDATGRVIRTLDRIPSESGFDLYLTVDSKLQKVAQDAFGNECGALVVMKPKTGEVLALVSNPGFDPNLFVTGIPTKTFRALQSSLDKPMYNRAIRGQFSPGSTIKPFLAIKGLDSGVINAKYTIHDPGWFQLPNSSHIYRNWVHRGQGNVNVVTALIVSCDTFFYNLAAMLGAKAINDILGNFGFGKKTNIDIQEELPGIVPSPKWKMRKIGLPWYPGDTVLFGVGQGYTLVTPLQLASSVATIATRGLRFQPHLLLKMQRVDGATKSFTPVAESPVILHDPKNWDIVIKGMRGVVESFYPHGTAQGKFEGVRYSVAAKTGTAQLFRHYLNENQTAAGEAKIPKRLRNNSLFIAFAPVDNPEIAVAVVVENSAIAGNIARKVMDYYLLSKKTSK